MKLFDPVSTGSQGTLKDKIRGTLERMLTPGDEVFLHATLRAGASSLLESGIDLLKSRRYLDLGCGVSFYLHPLDQLEDAIEWAEREFAHQTEPGPPPECALLVFVVPDSWRADVSRGRTYDWFELITRETRDTWMQLVRESRMEQKTALTRQADASAYVLGPIAKSFSLRTRPKRPVVPMTRRDDVGVPLLQLALKAPAVDYFSGHLRVIWSWQPNPRAAPDASMAASMAA